MGWLANFVGGPLDGHIEIAHGYWPFLARKVEHDFVGYHLVCCVVSSGGEIQPQTPIIYVWGGFDPEEASKAVDAYLSQHGTHGGFLEDYPFTRVTSDWLHDRKLRLPH